MILSARLSLSVIFISLSILISSKIKAQTFEVTLGGNMQDIAHDAVFLENGEMIVTGATYLEEGSGMDAYTAKLSNTGDIIWQTTIGYHFEDGGNEIVVGDDGNIFVAGHTDVTGTDICDAYCLYLSTQGDTIWTRKFGFDEDDVAYGCTEAGDGGFIAVGRAITFGDPVGFIIKYNKTGDQLWVKLYGTGGEDYFTDIIQSPDGGYYLSGRNAGTDGGDFWLMKIDEDGNMIWSTTYSTELIDIAYSIAISEDGGLLLAGKSYEFGSSSKIFLVRTDAQGQLIWQYMEGGYEHDTAHGAVATADGNWIITGTYFNLLTQSDDAMLMELNDAGAMNWIKFYGSSNDDSGQRVNTDGNGHLLICGAVNYFGDDDMLIMKTDEWGDVASSISNTELQSTTIRVFPNPCDEEVAFQLNQLNGEMQLVIYDLTGKIVFEQDAIHSELLTINTNQLTPGIYCYRLTDLSLNAQPVCGQLAVK